MHLHLLLQSYYSHSSVFPYGIRRLLGPTSYHLPQLEPFGGQ